MGLSWNPWVPCHWNEGFECFRTLPSLFHFLWFFVVSCDSLLLWLNVHAIKYAILTLLIVLFCGIKCIHIAVQPLPPFISRTFSSFQRETLYPSSSLFASWPAAGNHYSFSASMNKWNHTIFTLLWLTSFIWHNVLKFPSCYSMCQNFLPLSVWIKFYWMNLLPKGEILGFGCLPPKSQ